MESLTSLIGDLSGLPASPLAQDKPQEGNQSRLEQSNQRMSPAVFPSKPWVTFEGEAETDSPLVPQNPQKSLDNGAEQNNLLTATDRGNEIIWGTSGLGKVKENDTTSSIVPQNLCCSGWVDAKQDSKPLQGITLHNASFTPHFPEINPGETEEGEELFPTQGEMSGKGGESAGGWLEDIWKDFTAILESKTPGLGSFRDRKNLYKESRNKGSGFGVFKGEQVRKDFNEKKCEEKTGNSERREFVVEIDDEESNENNGNIENRNTEDNECVMEKEEIQPEKKEMTKQKSKSLFRKFRAEKEETKTGREENEVKMKKKRAKGEKIIEKFRKKKRQTEDKENTESNLPTLSTSSSSSSLSSSSSNSKRKVDLSDMPFLLHPSPSLKTSSSFPSLTSITSISPSSCNITTNQRLQDIQTLQDRLQAIRKSMRERVQAKN